VIRSQLGDLPASLTGLKHTGGTNFGIYSMQCSDLILIACPIF